MSRRRLRRPACSQVPTWLGIGISCLTLAAAALLPAVARGQAGGRPVHEAAPVAPAPQPAPPPAPPPPPATGRPVHHAPPVQPPPPPPPAGRPVYQAPPSAPPPPTIVGWSPRSGPVGTVVSIHGHGFRPGSAVLLAGQGLPLLQVGPALLRATVPDWARSGMLAVRVPAVGDFQLGPFTVERPLPLIHSFSPASGPAGTLVELRGHGFLPTDSVWLGDRQLASSFLSPAVLQLQIPRGAQSGPLIVARGPLRTASTQIFTVVHQPTIVAFHPASGPPGTRVRISGQNLRLGGRLHLGGIEIPYEFRSPSDIQTVIPEGARTDYFVLRTPLGGTRSPQPFVVTVPPPLLTGFTPPAAPVGAHVRLHGSNLLPGDAVFLAGQPLTVLQVTPAWLTVAIPTGARSGHFSLRRGGFESVAPRPFQVVWLPAIIAMSPQGGPPGTLVRISGSGFPPDATVTLSGRPVAVLARHGNSGLLLAVPAAPSGPFIVHTPAGQVRSPRFEVMVQRGPLVITGFAPASGPPGSVVTIKGGPFDLCPDLVARLSGRPLPVVQRQFSSLAVEILPGVPSGRFEVTCDGVRAHSTGLFQVR